MEDLFVELQWDVDLTRAYHPVVLDEESCKLTAFIAHDGLFQFCQAPHGLALAPSAFQKLMPTPLKGLQGVQNYLDDVIMYWKTVVEHYHNQEKC